MRHNMVKPLQGHWAGQTYRSLGLVELYNYNLS